MDQITIKKEDIHPIDGAENLYFAEVGKMVVLIFDKTIDLGLSNKGRSNMIARSNMFKYITPEIWVNAQIGKKERKEKAVSAPEADINSLFD